MANRKALRDAENMKAIRKTEKSKQAEKSNKAEKNVQVKKSVQTRKSKKAETVKNARLHRGVAGVAVASTLAMMLPSVAAAALQPTQKDIIDASSTTQKMGKGKPDVDELNMQRWGASVLNKSAQTQKFVELARRDIEAKKLREAQQLRAEQQLRAAQQREIEQREVNNSEVNNSEVNKREVNNSEAEQGESQPRAEQQLRAAQQRGIDSQLYRSSEQVNFGHSSDTIHSVQSATPTKTSEKTSEIKNAASGSKASASSIENTVSAAGSTAGFTTVSAPASDSVVKNATADDQANQKTAKPDATKPVEEKQPEEKQPDANAGGVNTAENKQLSNAKPAASNADSEGTKPAEVNPAENQQPENAQSGNAESAKTATEQNTNAQPASTHAENTNTVNDANTPKGRTRRSVVGGDGASDGSSVTPADNTTATPNAAPASNTTAPSTPVTSTGTEANAGAGTTANPSSEKPSAQTNAQGSQSSAEGATTGATSEDKSATPSDPGSTSSPTSTPTTGTPNAGATNTATDPNSQVIKPNTDNTTADSTDKANEQVQTDKKPKATYNLKIRYTIGGAANKQLVQPYELTIDVEKLNKLDNADSPEYIELPKAAGYRPSVYHSGTYQYYVKNSDGKFVIDDGTDADADRYLRLSKKLITDYAVKERPAVGGNNGAQAPQTSSSQATTNPQSSSSTEPKAEDGIQYYGELNINYAPKTAKYYVRHLVQNLKDKDKFDEAPNIGKPIVVEHKIKDKNGKVTTTKEVIHVTEITGTVGSNVTAVSTYIRGYEPEHNLISSPLSDSEDESDKLVLNLRYYRKAYEVTYDSAGGTDVTAQKVYYGQKVPEVSEPTYRGHTFLGWEIVQPGDNTNLSGDNNNRSSASNRSVTNEAHNYIMPDHDVKFRAAWSANEATNYRVNVWVQKADLVDKEHSDSLANYDFVGLVERKNVQTDSEVALDKMNDAGVVDDASKLNGASETEYVKNPELGLTKEELQGKDSKHETGLIAKFNWMNDTHVTNLDGYDTKNPDAAGNKGKDLFTRYFHVNKELTKKLNTEKHDFVPGRPDLGKRSKSQLCANDLNNTLNLVYDRNTYELIFAKPAGKQDNGLNNAAIKRKDEHGKTTIYCYAGGGNCSEKYDGKDGDDNGAEINHKGYSVKVRYGQKLTDIWPGVEEIDLSNDISDDGDKAFLGWKIGFAGKTDYRDTPPFRLTKKEFADPSLRVVGDGQAPKISDDPSNPNAQQYELKDNQRLLTADTTGASNDIPYTVIIKKQSIASAKNGDTGNDIKYELSTDTYSKDDTSHTDYAYTAPSIAGFSSVSKPECDTKDRDDFNDDSEALYEASSEYKKDSEEWDKLTDDDEITEAQAKGLLNFRKKYHIKFRDYLGPAPSDSDEDPDAAYGPDAPSDNYEKNAWLEMKYKRQKYAVQFYNADGNAITKDNVAATEELPFEYSLTKRGNAKLTGEDADLYYDGGSVKSYDASVTKVGGDNIATQFDGKYTFTLNGTKYSIERPENLPKDYVFKGWAVDQAGIHLINGKINDNSEGTEGDGKAKGETKDFTMPVNGIKLYAAWGKPEGIKHTVTLNYNMPETDENGKEKSGTNVVTKKQFDHYYVIKENKDIKVPTRKGYDFYGWEIKKNGTTLPYAFGNKVVEDITLDAVWVKDTRYNGTFKHIFLKPGYTFADYKNATDKSAKAAMVDHVSTQTVSGLREHLRYNAEAVYSDETHFPDKHFTSFEASSNEDQNTGEFIYQTYNTRKYKVRYVTIGKDGKEKDLLPESEVSSVNRKYDVAFYKPIEGFMPESTQQNIEYATGKDGKQIGEKTYTFRYKDVRVLKRQDDTQHRPTNYTRYVFKVADNQSSMGSVVDWQGIKVADGSALVYDAIKGTKAYQMPLPTVKAKPGYEFDVWTSKIYIDDGHGGQTHTDGFDRLPILSESQPNPKVIYTVKFKLKAPVAIDTKVLKPTDALSLDDNSAKELIKNADKYPSDAKFSFAKGERFDSTPGLHKIKVQVHLDGNTAAAEVLYRVLPDLVYASDWDKFSQSDYGSKYADKYVPINFTGKNDEGKLIGHDGDNTDASAGATTTLTAYVYKGKDVRIRVPQAFGNDYSGQHYHYVFKGWATKVVEPTTSTPSSGTSSSGTPSSSTPKPEEKKPEQTFDINSSDRYKNVKLDNGVTYHAIYKRIDYFSSSSDNGTVPEDSVIAIFKPAPKRKWKDGSDGPKVFYVKKGTDLSKIPYSSDDPTSALTRLKENLTNAIGTWNRSSMINGKEEVTPIDDVSNWKVNEPFQEFVADQKDWTQPEVQSDYLVAVQDKPGTLPKLEDYLTNLDDLKKEAETKGDVKDVTIEYDLPEGKKPEDFETEMLKKPSLYTVPLKITVNYKDGAKPEPYKRVARLKVIYQLMYDKSLPKPDSHTEPGSQQPGGGSQPGTTTETTLNGVAAERDLVLNKDMYVKVNFINAEQVNNKDQGSLDENATKLYYVLKKVDGDSTSGVAGVKAPQAVGKDYDDAGYHYVFRGWKLIEGEIIDASGKTIKGTAQTSSATVPSEHDATHPSAVRSAFTAMPFTTFLVTDATTPTTINESNVGNVNNAENDKIYTSEEVKKWKFRTNARLQAAYEKVNNVIDAKSKDKIPDNYVPYVFLPAFGRKWEDGSYKPKVIYFKSKNSEFKKSVDETDKQLSSQLKGFSKWEVYDAGNSPVLESDKYANKQIRVFVANQTADMPVNVSQFVKSVGDEVPAPKELVSDVDPKHLEIAGMHGAGVVYSSGANSVRIAKPGITTVRVRIEKADPNKKDKTVVSYEDVPIQVLPNVISERDLPSFDSQAGKFILENYTRVTYVAGGGGTMQSPMHTYWVRKGRMSEINNYIPDVRENAGYVFKDWERISCSIKHIDTIYNSADNHKSTDIEREGLAKIAELRGESYLARIIRGSKNSTFAALKNLLLEAKPDKHAQYVASREKLAQIAEASGKSFVASIIRKSEKSSIAALNNLLVEAGCDDARMVLPNVETDTIIVANFEKMAPMKFKFSGSAREGIFTNFRLQNMTEGNLNADGTPDTKNTKITVDGQEVTINDLVSQVKNSVNGINATCKDGTACTISGTPKVVNGQTKVELKFTTTDKYGREAEFTMEIDVIPEYTPVPLPPTPEPQPEQQAPAPVPTPEIPFVPDFAPSVIPEAQVIEPEVEQAEQPEQTEPETAQPETESKPVLAKTGSNVEQSAILAGLLASVGFAGFAAKHRRKREDKE